MEVSASGVELRFKNRTEGYGLTDFRDLNFFLTEPNYPSAFLNLKELAGKKVLDAGGGTNAAFALDLRKKGIDAFSVDVATTIDSPYALTANLADWSQMKEVLKTTGKVDVIYSHWAVFLGGKVTEVQRAALANLKRMLRPGGKLRITPIGAHYPEFDAMVRDIPGFKVLRSSPGDPFDVREYTFNGWDYVELERTRTTAARRGD